MSDRLAALMGVFGTTDFLLPLTLGDLTDDEARTRSRGGEGPSIAWTVGHLLHYRHVAMSLLGPVDDNPFEERFGAAGATAGDEYPTLEELLQHWSAVGGAFRATLTQATDEALDATLGSAGHDERSVMDRLAFFAFHEGYHMGALGALRKALGHPGPAEQVMALREAGSGGRG